MLLALARYCRRMPGATPALTRLRLMRSGLTRSSFVGRATPHFGPRSRSPRSFDGRHTCQEAPARRIGAGTGYDAATSGAIKIAVCGGAGFIRLPRFFRLVDDTLRLMSPASFDIAFMAHMAFGRRAAARARRAMLSAYDGYMPSADCQRRCRHGSARRPVYAAGWRGSGRLLALTTPIEGFSYIDAVSAAFRVSSGARAFAGARRGRRMSALPNISYLA